MWVVQLRGRPILINMLEIHFTHKLLHKTNNKPRKLVDKFLKWLDSTEPTFFSSVIAVLLGIIRMNHCTRMRTYI